MVVSRRFFARLFFIEFRIYASAVQCQVPRCNIRKSQKPELGSRIAESGSKDEKRRLPSREQRYIVYFQVSEIFH